MDDKKPKSYFNYKSIVTRNEIKEILNIEPYLITLNTAKVAHVYNKYTEQLIGILNVDIDWDIKTLMFNIARESVIVIYVKKQRVTARKAIQCCEVKRKDFGKLNDRKVYKQIFTSEEILYPGYIEFDEPTKMAVTKTSYPPSLKIWSLLDYKMLFSLSPDEAEYAFEVRFAQKLVILIKKVNDFQVAFDIIEPKTGSTIK